MNKLTFRQQLIKHNKPEEVRQRLAAGEYNSPNDKIAQEYLDSYDREQAKVREDKKHKLTIRITIALLIVAILALFS